MKSIYSFKVTNSFSRENLNYDEGTVKNIHYGDVHTKFQALFDITKEFVPFINPSVSIDRISEESYCQKGDLILADASEDLSDVGKSIELINLNNEKVLSGLHTILARPDLEKLDVGFGGCLFKSSNVRTQIQKESQGSKVLSISPTRISNIDLTYPSKKEQQKIVSLLSLIDERISTQNKIIEYLETLIKGISEKLFSQGLRFRDDNGSNFPEWEEKTGNEVFDSISNKEHNSDLPILAITQDQGAIPRDLIEYQISVTDKSVESYKVVEIGDFIISLRSFQGGIEYSAYRGICSPAYIILRNKVEVDTIFYKHYFKTDSYIKLLNKKLEGIRDGKMISYKYFSEIDLPYPTKKEQTKIANLLSIINKKNEAEKDILHQYQNQKRFLLQHLFI